MKETETKKMEILSVPIHRWWPRFVEKTQTLRFRFLGIVVMSVLIPSFLGGWYASIQIGEALQDQVHADIRNKTEVAARHISDRLLRLEQEVRAFSSSFLLNDEVRKIEGGLQPAELEKSRGNIDRYISYLLEDSDQFSGFAIIRADGSILNSHLEGGEGIPMETLPALAGNQPTFVEFEGDAAPLVVVLQRMNLGGGIGSTVFAAILHWGVIQSTVEALAGPDSTLYLMDNDGRIKASSAEMLPGALAPAGALPLVGGKIDRADYRGVLGHEVIATWVPVSEIPWGVVLETSRSKALRRLTTFRAQLILMALVLAALFLVPALFLARTIIVPLEELSRVSRQIKKGKLGTEVKTRASGELGEFIQTFNSMSLSLQENLEELRIQSEQMRVMTITDPLTGRYNRRYIEDYLSRELELAVRTSQPLAILMIDLDRFKDYNDTYGHIAGDEALKQLADLLVGTVRKTDVVARFGGEEWIVCLSHTDTEGGLMIAEKIRQAIEENVFLLRGEKTRITVSIGLAMAPENGATFGEIVEAADMAMYLAKDAGRNRVEVFTAPGPGGSSPQARKASSPESTPPVSPGRSQSPPGKDSQGARKTRKEKTSKRHS